MVEVKVAGKVLALSSMKKEELKGIPIDTKLKFQFYRATFNENAFCLLETKKEDASIDLSYNKEMLYDNPDYSFFMLTIILALYP